MGYQPAGTEFFIQIIPIITNITPTKKKNETKIYKKNNSFLSHWCNCTPKGFMLFDDYNLLGL